MDMTKYRAVFLEEATEHLSEMSGALLELEKEPSSSDAIDLAFLEFHEPASFLGTTTRPHHSLTSM